MHLLSETAKSAFIDKEFIARIHGSVEYPEDIILSESSYKELKKDDYYHDFLYDLFSRKQVLFLGFSFLDPAITDVLDSVKKRFGHLSDGDHLALLPSNVPPELESKLIDLNIEVVKYPDGRHDRLWEAISLVSLSEKDTVKASPKDETFDLVKNYLASCYARLKIRSKSDALWRVAIEGVTSSLIQKAGSSGITFGELLNLILSQFTFDEETAKSLVRQSIQALIDDKLCEKRPSPERFIWISNGNSAYQEAAKVIREGITNRMKVRYGIPSSGTVDRAVEKVVETMIAERGWDLGAAFATKSPVEEINPAVICSQIEPRSLSLKQREALEGSLKDIIERPDSIEAEKLADLGRMAFAIELMAQTPSQTLASSGAIPDIIYLDANVLMPAIVAGHPYSEAYKLAIQKLSEASEKSGRSVSICVYHGFLNEIVSHKNIALNEIEQFGDNALRQISREVKIFGSSNVNVFIGSYASSGNWKEGETFESFLERSAPYSSEKELQSYLEKIGINVISDLQMHATQMPEILSILETKYSDEFTKKGAHAILLKHDAVQLGKLDRDAKEGKNSLFVTADKSLKTVLSDSGYENLSNKMVNHVALVQLADLLGGMPDGNRSFSQLMWTTSSSSEANMIRDYFVGLGLEQYSAALALDMQNLIEEVSEETIKILNDKGLSLWSSSTEKKLERARILEAQEDKFYQNMRSVMEEIENRDK
ncbi:MAG: SIR2 family protein [Thalassolituus sp.]